MERDPVRFVWRAAPGLNGVLIALALAAAPGIWAVLDLVAAVVDRLAIDPGTKGSRAPPTRLLEQVLLLTPGAPLSRDALSAATVVALVVAAGAAGLYVYATGRIRSAVGRRSIDALGRRLIAGIATAPVSAYEAARLSATLAGNALVGQRAVLGGLLATPALSAAALAAAVIATWRTDGRLAALLAIGLGAFLAAQDVRERRIVALGAAQDVVGKLLRRLLDDLSTHLPAINAHGTAMAEQARIATGLGPPRQAITDSERRLGAATGLVLALAWATPVGVLGLSSWLDAEDLITPGQGVAATLAGAFGLVAAESLHRWRRSLAGVRPLFDEARHHLTTLAARRRRGPGAPLSAYGRIVAEHVTTDMAPTGGRLSSLDLTLTLPSHVALTGETGSGFQTFARILGGQVTPRSGRIVFDGTDLADVDPAERARRLAFAGGRTLLLPGTLRDNFAYGADLSRPDLDDRIEAALAVAHLTDFVYRRGLSGMAGPGRGPGDLTDGIVEARGRIGTALAAAGLDGLVRPFDAERYSPHATIGENILFGVAVDASFRDRNLASQPFLRSLLEREHLTAPLAALGLAIARSTIEMFWGLPNRSSIVGRFSLMSGGEREEFDRILRRETDPAGAASGQDADRLIGLAFRYSERRHRLGLLEADLEDRLLRVRRAFGRELPTSLSGSVAFFAADRICPAASVLDNLLFGRIAEEQASARRDVLAVVRTVVAAGGLERSIVRLGLESRVDPAASGLSPSRIAAIDLVRCLVRRPDNLVVDGIFDDLTESEAEAQLGRLRDAMTGQGLVVALPQAFAALAESLDEVKVFASGRIRGVESPPNPAGSMPASETSNPWRPNPAARSIFR